MKERLSETRLSDNVIRKRRRSLLAWLMVLAMVVTLLPADVRAADYDIGSPVSVAGQDPEYNLTSLVGKVLEPGDTIKWMTSNSDVSASYYPNKHDAVISYNVNNDSVFNETVSAVASPGNSPDGKAAKDTFQYSHTVISNDKITGTNLTSEQKLNITGWMVTEESKVDIYDSGCLSISSITLTPCYVITWKDGDGNTLVDTLPEGATPSYSGTTEPKKSSTAQYDYTFKEWSSGDTTAPTSGIVNVIGPATYTAQFDESLRKYKVIFDANGHGSAPAEKTDVSYGSKVSNPGDLTETGYTFGGWYKDKACTAGNKWNFDQNVLYEDCVDATNGTMTLYAKWTVNSYTVTFNANGQGTAPASQTVDYGNKVTEPTAPEVKGYTFGGWYADSECTKVWDFATSTVTDNVTLYAKWTINNYNVTFVDSDGTTVLKAAKSYSYGTKASSVELPADDPVKAKDAQYTYTFAGWEPKVADVTDNATYKASYTETVNKYTVTWKNEDGTVLETDAEVPYGTLPAYDGEEPTKVEDEGSTYTFAGWDKEISKVEGDVSYTATYTQNIKSFKVTFDINGQGTAPAEQNVEYDKTAAEPEAPEVKGYTFGGWYREKECTNEWNFNADTVKNNITFYAKWTINNYNVTFVDSDGTTVLKEAKSYSYGTKASSVELPADVPVKEKDAQYTYTFAGWEPAVEDVTDDATYKASYTATVNKYTVTFDINGQGTAPAAQTIDYGNKVAEPKAPEATGYTFGGWYKDKACTDANVWTFDKDVVTDAVTLYAKWTEVKKEAEPVKPTTTEQQTDTTVKPATTEQKTELTVEDLKSDSGTEKDMKNSSFGSLFAGEIKYTSNSITLKWKKIKGADGYAIFGNQCNHGKHKYNYQYITSLGANKTTWKATKLKKNKYYKYYVAAYKLVNGEKVIICTSKTVHATTVSDKYGAAEKIKLDKTKVKLKVGKTYKLKAKEINLSRKIQKHRPISYESADTSVATVNKKGVIKAVGKGKCKIWVFAQNGKYTSCTVTVK